MSRCGYRQEEGEVVFRKASCFDSNFREMVKRMYTTCALRHCIPAHLESVVQGRAKRALFQMVPSKSDFNNELVRCFVLLLVDPELIRFSLTFHVLRDHVPTGYSHRHYLWGKLDQPYLRTTATRSRARPSRNHPSLVLLLALAVSFHEISTPESDEVVGDPDSGFGERSICDLTV